MRTSGSVAAPLRDRRERRDEREPAVSNKNDYYYPPTSGRSGSGSLGRAEFASDDERPFAEIRKSLNDLLRMVALHRWVFFIPFCIVSCGAFVASLYFPRTYRATSTFERHNDPVMMNLPMSAGAASFRYFRNTTKRDITSEETLGVAVERMGLLPDLERGANGELSPAAQARLDAMARSLATTLDVTTTSPSELIDVIKITYTGPDPKIGRRLVDEVKKAYIERTMAWIYEFLVSQRDYFQKQAEDELERLRMAERERTQLRMQNPLIDPNDPGAISMRLTQLESDARELERRKREYQAELAAQQQLLVAFEPERVTAQIMANEGEEVPSVVIPKTARVLELEREIRDLDEEVAMLRQTRGMTDEHPDIKEKVSRRKHLNFLLEEAMAVSQTVMNQALAASEPSTNLEAMPGPWQSERARLLVQISAIESKLKDVKISLESNQAKIEQIRVAKSEIFDKQDEFAGVAKSLSDARVRHAQLAKTVSEISPAIEAIEKNRLMQFSPGNPARGASTPVSPKSTTIILLALMAGVAAGAVFVILAELFDHVYRNSSQVSRVLGLPILEAIDEIVTAQDRRRALVKRAVVTPVLIVFCVGVTGVSGAMAYLSLHQPTTYEKLRTFPQAAIEMFVETDEASAGS